MLSKALLMGAEQLASHGIIAEEACNNHNPEAGQITGFMNPSCEQPVDCGFCRRLLHQCHGRQAA